MGLCEIEQLPHSKRNHLQSRNSLHNRRKSFPANLFCSCPAPSHISSDIVPQIVMCLRKTATNSRSYLSMSVQERGRERERKRTVDLSASGIKERNREILRQPSSGFRSCVFTAQCSQGYHVALTFYFPNLKMISNDFFKGTRVFRMWYLMTTFRL